MRKSLWVALLAVVMAVTLVTCMHNREERRIQRRLNALQKLVIKNQTESPLAVLLRCRQISEFFTKTSSVELGDPLPTLEGRDSLLAVMQQVYTSAESVKISVRDSSLNVEADRRHAVMNVTAAGEIAMDGQTDHQIREFQMRWIRDEDGNWRIDGVKLNETIRPPEGLDGKGG